jgi:Uncharacterized conserved protein
MRIEERHDFLGYYVRNASQGHFGIAGFQRQYAWTQLDIEKFLESVCDQLPIGGFLLWTLDKDQVGDRCLSKGRIGPIQHDPNTRTLILDGQNRLSSILWAARKAEAPETPDYPYSPAEVQTWFSGQTLVADSAEKRLHFVPDSAAYSSTRFPLGKIMAATLLQLTRSTDLFAEMQEVGIPDSDLNWFFDDIPDYFRSKKTTITEISYATPEEAFDVFLRVCRTGQPVTDEDIEAAKRWMFGE